MGTAEIARDCEELAGGWMCFGGDGSWANQACGLGLSGPVSEADIDRLIAFYTSRNTEPQIEVSPFADETLIAELARRGFQLREFENVLARELKPKENLQALHPHSLPDGLTIAHVDPSNAAQVESFASASTQGFRTEGTRISEVDALMTEKIVRHPRCDAFLANIDGTDVGGGAMAARGELACLFSASVAADHQRRGVHAALMIRRLERARERGCSVAVIHSTPEATTERNARRLGFALAYTRVIMTMPGLGLKPSP